MPLANRSLYCILFRSLIAASIDRRCGLFPLHQLRTAFMIHFPLNKQGALETWLAGEISNLAGSVSASEAGFFLLGAQLTDLENRCAAGQDRARRKSATSKKFGMKDRWGH